MTIIKFNRETRNCTVSLSYDEVVAISNGFYELSEIGKPINTDLRASFYDLHILIKEGRLIKDDHKISFDILQHEKSS